MYYLVFINKDIVITLQSGKHSRRSLMVCIFSQRLMGLSDRWRFFVPISQRGELGKHVDQEVHWVIVQSKKYVYVFVIIYV